MVEVDVEEVSAIIREVGRRRIVPRFRNLGPGSVDCKAPGDMVTVADREAEADLAARLAPLIAGSLFIGEEAACADPGILDALSGERPVWVVDPLDGTSNFVRGSPDFTTMVALVRNGHALAGWIHAPLPGWTAVAVRGHGAHLDGRPLGVARPPPIGALRVAVTHPDYQTENDRPLYSRLARVCPGLLPSRGAGLEYVGLAAGVVDAAVFTWEKPWDHAAGLLIHAEAGGINGMRSGLPFNPSGGNDLPLIAAPDEMTFKALQKSLQA